MAHLTWAIVKLGGWSEMDQVTEGAVLSGGSVYEGSHVAQQECMADADEFGSKQLGYNLYIYRLTYPLT